MHPFNRIADGLSKSKIYWTYGSPPKGSLYSCVQDPPTSGWSSVLVIGGEGPKGELQVLCPYTLLSYIIRKDSHERASMQGMIGMKTQQQEADYFRDILPRKWGEVKRHGQHQADWALAERVMAILGVTPPSDEEVAKLAPVTSQIHKAKSAAAPAGKPAAPEAAFKPVKKVGRKGEVLAAILEGMTSADALTSKFSITRSNLLSQLFLLRKNHGIGYTVSGNTIALQMPEGVSDPFDG